MPEKRRPQVDDLEPLLQMIAEGGSLNASCKELGLDTPSTYHWLHDDDGRRQKYARTCEVRADYLQEQALTLGMGAAAGKVKPDGARVAIDAIKWATARMAPKTAPVTRVRHSFEELSDEELDARIAAKLAADEDLDPDEP